MVLRLIPRWLRPISLDEEIELALKDNRRATLECLLALDTLNGKLAGLRRQETTLRAASGKGPDLARP